MFRWEDSLETHALIVFLETVANKWAVSWGFCSEAQGGKALQGKNNKVTKTKKPPFWGLF